MSSGFPALWLFAALGSAVAPDGLCYRLNNFERELALSRSARSTTVKVTWLPGEGSVMCAAHRQHPGARELCRWLPKNMSWEFPHLLPRAMLACYGITGDPFAQGTLVTGSYAGRTKARNRVEIETEQGATADSLPSVRLTIRKGAR